MGNNAELLTKQHVIEVIQVEQGRELWVEKEIEKYLNSLGDIDDIIQSVGISELFSNGYKFSELPKTIQKGIIVILSEDDEFLKKTFTNLPNDNRYWFPKIDNINIGDYVKLEKTKEFLKKQAKNTVLEIHTKNSKQPILASFSLYWTIMTTSKMNEDITFKALANFLDWMVQNEFIDYGLMNSDIMRIEISGISPDGIVVDKNGREAVGPDTIRYVNHGEQICKPEEVTERFLYMIYCFPHIKWNSSYFVEMIEEKLGFNFFMGEKEAPEFVITESQINTLLNLKINEE